MFNWDKLVISHHGLMIILLFSMNKSQISNNLGHKIKVEKCQFLFENMKIRNNTDIATCIKVCGQNMTT